MANNRRKSAAIALAIVGIAGLSLASASHLIVNTQSLQAGSEVLVDCDSDGVTVSYGYAWSVADAEYQANSVTVSDIECASGNIGVTLRAGAASTTTLAATPITGAIMTMAITPISAELLSDVDVVIAN